MNVCLNQPRSESELCLIRPSSDRLDGGEDRSLSCSLVRPAHFFSSVARWYSSQAISISRSSAMIGGSVCSGSGATQEESDIVVEDLVGPRYVADRARRRPYVPGARTD